MKLRKNVIERRVDSDLSLGGDISYIHSQTIDGEIYR